MCGRYVITFQAEELGQHFGLDSPAIAPIKSRYNVAPSQAILALRNGPTGTWDAPEWAWLTWGLVPSWASDPAIAYKTINARAETLREKPSFRDAFRYRRCLVPVTGYYEWSTDFAGNKVPHYITPTDRPFFVFAGLWEHWSDPGGSEIESACLLTTSSDKHPSLAKIHHRMPVIVDPEDYRHWLGVDPPDDPKYLRLTRSRDALSVETRTVSQHVNSARSQGPQLIEHAAYFRQDELF